MKTKNNKTNLKQDVAIIVLGLFLVILLLFLWGMTSTNLSNLRSNLTIAQNTIIAQKANLTALQTSLNAKEALIQNLSAQLQNQSKLLNLSITKVLFNSPVYLPSAYNTTLCYFYCYNITKAGNYTLSFNISHAGYLSISSPSNSTINIIVEEIYANNIPTNYETYSQLFHTISPVAYFTTELNSTTSPMPIPVLPGRLTLKLYNYNYYPLTLPISIKYVS